MVSVWCKVLRRGHKYHREEEPLTGCGGRYGALTSAHLDSSSAPSTWLPAATYLHPPELRHLTSLCLSFSQVNEPSTSRCGGHHHIQIDRNPQPCKTDTKYIQMITKQSLKRDLTLAFWLFLRSMNMWHEQSFLYRPSKILHLPICVAPC